MNKTIQEILKEDYSKWKNREYIHTRKSGKYTAKTFGETITDVLSLSEVLLSKNLRNQNIGIYSENSYEWMISDLSVMGYVGTTVALDKSWSLLDASNAILHTDIKCLIYSNSKMEIVNKLKETHDILYISMQDDLPRLLEAGYELLKQKSDIFAFGEKDFEKMSKIVFSSGTTSIPKAVMLSQKNMLMGWENLYLRAPMNDTDICYLFLPLHHTYAGLCNFLFSLISGMQIYLCSDTSKIAEELPIVKPTVFCTVPLICERFYNSIGNARLLKIEHELSADRKNNKKEQFSDIRSIFGGNIRYMFCGGAPLDKAIKNFFRNVGINMLDAYALSETSSILSIEYSHTKNSSAGTIFENIDVKLFDKDESGCGEIIVKGDNVFLGYYKNEKATMEAFDENGYFHTGDIGYIDENNELHLSGRKKRLIVLSNGEKVYPDMIEQVLKQNDGISNAKVYEDSGLIKATLYITDEIDADRIIAETNKQLPKYCPISHYTVRHDSINIRLK